VRNVVLIGLVVMVVAIAACGSDDPASQAGHESGNADHETDTGGAPFPFGEPGDQANADRTIDVAALDTLEFDPDSITLRAEDTITFVVTNEGKNVHEFVIGDESYQQEHAAEMSGGHQMEMGANGIEIGPGETKSLTWTFTEAVEVLYGCHERGHYEGGMVGTIEVAS
jgi:uncharacterized cupredoxin-like copper-binding protein